jgi:hypothetical protein
MHISELRPLLCNTVRIFQFDAGRIASGGRNGPGKPADEGLLDETTCSLLHGNHSAKKHRPGDKGSLALALLYMQRDPVKIHGRSH